MCCGGPHGGTSRRATALLPKRDFNDFILWSYLSLFSFLIKWEYQMQMSSGCGPARKLLWVTLWDILLQMLWHWQKDINRNKNTCGNSFNLWQQRSECFCVCWQSQRKGEIWWKNATEWKDWILSFYTWHVGLPHIWLEIWGIHTKLYWTWCHLKPSMLVFSLSFSLVFERQRKPAQRKWPIWFQHMDSILSRVMDK